MARIRFGPITVAMQNYGSSGNPIGPRMLCVVGTLLLLFLFFF